MSNIHVMHVIAGSLNGGAARGAYWLFRALRERGIEGCVLNNTASGFAWDGIDAPRRWLESSRYRGYAILEQAHKLLHPRRRRASFNTGFYGIDLTRSRPYDAADVVHLHWVNQGFVRMSALDRIDKPLVWTFRDLWPGTGGCHYPMGCGKFTSGCGACPQLGSSAQRDLSRQVFENKRAHMPGNLVGVGISHWVADTLKQSPILAKNRIEMIPNAVPVDSFYPQDRLEQRATLGLPPTQRIVLVGAESLDKFHKGFDLFKACLRYLPEDVLVLTFGHIGSVDLQGVRHRHLGYLEGFDRLRTAYAAADAYVLPSREEAFGKTVCESMACGTPVVAFDATGPRDIITHRADGYLATAFSPEGLAKGISWILDHPERAALSRDAIRKVREQFSTSVVASQYAELYRSLLE